MFWKGIGQHKESNRTERAKDEKGNMRVWIKDERSLGRRSQFNVIIIIPKSTSKGKSNEHRN